jgi:hypothetical protein
MGRATSNTNIMFIDVLITQLSIECRELYFYLTKDHGIMGQE